MLWSTVHLPSQTIEAWWTRAAVPLFKSHRLKRWIEKAQVKQPSLTLQLDIFGPAWAGVELTIDQLQDEPIRIAPHPRTLRKAREQVKAMVVSGFSAHQIKTYLQQWARWWVNTTECWKYEALLE